MEYYIMEQDHDYTDAPVITNWFGKINTEDIRQGRYEELDSQYVLTASGDMDIDIITMPFLAVSPMMLHCIQGYEPNVEATPVYLLDKKKEKVSEYWIPHLEEINCMSDESRCNRNKTVLEKAVLNRSKIKPDCYIFRLGGLNTSYTVVRIELVESMLKRGATGIGLREVLIDQNGGE